MTDTTKDPMFQVMGWMRVDAAEAKRVMDAWGTSDIKAIAAILAFATATELQPNQGGGGHHFAMLDGDHTIRLNVQDGDRFMLISPEVIDDADIHITAYWSDWSVLFMGWQWSVILKKRPPKRSYGDKKDYYTQEGVDTRPMSDLMKQISPEKMEKLEQGVLI